MNGSEYIHKATDGLGPIKSLCTPGWYQLAEKWENVTCPECLHYRPMKFLTIEDLKLIEELLVTADVENRLGTCEEYADDKGFCRICTALSNLDMEIHNVP